MFRRFSAHSVLLFGSGLLAGLLVGIGMVAGVLIGDQFGAHRSTLKFPETALHAAATHGGDSIIMATGPIDEGNEGVFLLDCLTGNLQCNAINSRTLTSSAVYKYNIVADLGIGDAKVPKYLMVTGKMSARIPNMGNMSLAESICFVCDANTGKWVAYSLPWDRTAKGNLGAVQQWPMKLIGGGAARDLKIRD